MNDQRPDPSSTPVETPRPLPRKRTDLESSATFLTFEAGLYAIDFRARSGNMSDVGLPLPCARLEPIVMPSSPGRAFVSMTPDGGWLSRGTAAAHVLVVGGRAGAVLTIYRPSDGTPMPEVHFRPVVSAGQAAPQPAQAAQPAPTAPPAEAAADSLRLTVHVEGVGDRTEPSGHWAGDTAGLRSVEGFALTLPAGMAAADLEYQGIMGEDWRTPWFTAGAFCGSRGLQLPLLGFCLRLVGDAAEWFECLATGHFVRHGAVGPVSGGEDCHAGNMPLTAMKVELVARQPAAQPPAALPHAPEPPAPEPHAPEPPLAGPPPRPARKRRAR